MVRQCLDERTPFGLILALPSGVASVGCTAEILEVFQKYPDGRSDILTVGREPFRVRELHTDDPLLEGSVDYLEEAAAEAHPHRAELLELYETCYTLLFSEMPKELGELSRGELTYGVAGSLPLGLYFKQQLLELRSEAERQERLVKYLREWAPHLQEQKAPRDGSGGDGPAVN